MNRLTLAGTACCALLLSACGDRSADDVPRQRLTVTLTGIEAVKQGSEETVPIEGTPVEGAILTVEGS